MTIELTTKEKTVLQSYIREMLALFRETDMMQETDFLSLPMGEVEVSQDDFLRLEKKFENE